MNIFTQKGRTLLVAAVLAVGAAWLAGCGDKGTEAKGDGTAPGTTPGVGADLETIARYERLLDDCAERGLKSDRCADYMYALGGLYYDQAVAGIAPYSKFRNMYWRLSQEYPTFPRLPEAYYKMGLNYIETGDSDSARIVLLMLVDRFPNSPRVPDAKLRLRDLGVDVTAAPKRTFDGVCRGQTQSTAA